MFSDQSNDSLSGGGLGFGRGLTWDGTEHETPDVSQSDLLGQPQGGFQRFQGWQGLSALGYTGAG